MDFIVLNFELINQHMKGKRLKQYKAELVHSNYKKTPKNKSTKQNNNNKNQKQTNNNPLPCF